MLAVVAGASLGAAAVQGLHAQVKPKAYIVTETEVIDAAALAAYVPQAQAAVRAAGGVPGVVATGRRHCLGGRAAQALWRLGVGERREGTGLVQFRGTEGAHATARKSVQNNPTVHYRAPSELVLSLAGSESAIRHAKDGNCAI